MPNSVSTVLPRLRATWTLAGPEWIQQTVDGNARTNTAYEQSATNVLFFMDTIDLSAFVVQYKTFFPSNVEVAEPGIHVCGPDETYWNNQAALTVLDVVTSAPLDTTNVIADLENSIYPGSNLGESDDQFIMMGRLRMFAANINASFPGLVLPVSDHRFGSGLPTAADKLYCYRFILAQNQALTNASLLVPETKLTFVGVAEDEGELGRIYRLRQSYDQRQG